MGASIPPALLLKLNNMRQYRAWHKEEKVMCKVSTINFDKGAFLIGIRPGPDEIYDDQIVIAPDNGRFCEWDEIELMESTGLKDRNGVEVYEGDVITWEDYVSDDMYGGGVVHPEEPIEFKGGAFYPVCTMPETEFEVIGNIHTI